MSVLIDRSGSMTPLREQVLEGVNDLFGEQRKAVANAAGLRVTLAQFNSKQPFDLLIDAIPIGEVRDLEWHDFVPQGGTPLFDAVGRLIERVDDRPGEEDQIVAIVTDGQENASTDLRAGDVKRLIDERTEAGWTFLFLGANHDSFTAGERIGVRRGNTRNFAGSEHGTRRAFDEINLSVQAQRRRSVEERTAMADQLLAERSDETDLLE